MLLVLGWKTCQEFVEKVVYGHYEAVLTSTLALKLFTSQSGDTDLESMLTQNIEEYVSSAGETEQHLRYQRGYS